MVSFDLEQPPLSTADMIHNETASDSDLKPTVEHLEVGKDPTPDESFPSSLDTSIFGGNEAARQADRFEHQMSIKYALNNFWPALMWALIMSASIMMEGYETALIPSFFSYQPYCRMFGDVDSMKRNIVEDVHSVIKDIDGDGHMDSHLPNIWETAIPVAGAGGQLFGLFVAPTIVNRFGFRRSALMGLSVAGCLLLISFSATYLPWPKTSRIFFIVGEFLLGFPWGMFQSLILPYVADITPLKLRGIATTMINMFWLTGQIIGCGALLISGHIGNDLWAVRIPMLVQYSWIVPLFFAIIWAPESPVYLMRMGMDDAALVSLRRLTRSQSYDPIGALAAKRAVNTREAASESSMGFGACFQGCNARRTEVTVAAYVTQQLIGCPLIFYSVKLLQKAGLEQGPSLFVVLGMFGMCIVSNLASTAVLPRLGRRKLWIGGLVGDVGCLLAIAICAFLKKKGKEGCCGWIVSGLIILLAVIYNITIGPVAFTIISEAPATRLKASTNSIGRAAYIVLAMGSLFLVPKLLDDSPLGWGLGPKASLIWAGTGSACALWSFFRLPEMKDRTVAEIDILFEKEVPSRRWAHTNLKPKEIPHPNDVDMQGQQIRQSISGEQDGEKE